MRPALSARKACFAGGRAPHLVGSGWRALRPLATLPQPTHLESWVSENEASFRPPVMNKLMHRDQLSIMFVGGPNRREDFHLEAGSEFFYQLKGDIELPTVQAGRRCLVTIREGEVFLLPSRIPHSPQRPQPGSIGLVIERQRSEHEPWDCLRFYVDFETCEATLWERSFFCYDLGRDLGPVLAAYNASDEKRTRVPTAASLIENPTLAQDVTTRVPPPFSLARWLEEHDGTLSRGEALNLFEDHPDGEFRVLVYGGQSEQRRQSWKHETWLHQLVGEVTVTMAGQSLQVSEGAALIIPAGQEYCVSRPLGSRGLVLTNDPLGNMQPSS